MDTAITHTSWAALVMAAIMLLSPSGSAQEHLGFWRDNYTEVRPQDDSLVQIAHVVFEQVLDAAGRRPGVFPRLLVIRTGFKSTPMALAVPDGGIVLSYRALKVCFTTPSLGQDRLAFVLGHEIAHQLKDDFWHLRFFEAVDSARQDRAGRDSTVLHEIRSIAEMTDEVVAKELQADEHAIVYMAIAGYDAGAVLSDDDNFFSVWRRSVDAVGSTDRSGDGSHPTMEQRIETVRVRLGQVIEQLDLFYLGLDFYACGQFDRALTCFEQFERFFPSREVLHNIAACHHQLGLAFGHLAGIDMSRHDFLLPLTVAASTRADHLRSDSPPDSSSLTARHKTQISRAVELYLEVIARDPSFIPAYVNAASALLLQQRLFKAVGLLRDAHEQDSLNFDVLNALGVVMTLAGDADAGRSHFETATALDPANETVRFNLGLSRLAASDTTGAIAAWDDLLTGRSSDWWQPLILPLLDPDVVEPALVISDPGAETVDGIMPGFDTDEVRMRLGEPIEVSSRLIGDDLFVLSRYEGEVLVVSNLDEVQLIKVGGNYRGASSGEVRIGTGIAAVNAAYGHPNSTVNISRRLTWLFGDQGVAFEIQEGVVSGWILFP